MQLQACAALGFAGWSKEGRCKCRHCLDLCHLPKSEEMAKVSCCRKIPGRSLRGVRPESPVPGFSLLFVLCVVPLWCQSGVPPEGPRSLRVAGVSGPCDRSLRPVKASSTSLCPGAESPPCTGVSGPSDRSLRPSQNEIGRAHV